MEMGIFFQMACFCNSITAINIFTVLANIREVNFQSYLHKKAMPYTFKGITPCVC